MSSLVPQFPVLQGELCVGREVLRDQQPGHEQPSVPLLDQLLTQHVSMTTHTHTHTHTHIYTI